MLLPDGLWSSISSQRIASLFSPSTASSASLLVTPAFSRARVRPPSRGARAIGNTGPPAGLHQQEYHKPSDGWLQLPQHRHCITAVRGKAAVASRTELMPTSTNAAVSTATAESQAKCSFESKTTRFEALVQAPVPDSLLCMSPLSQRDRESQRRRQLQQRRGYKGNWKIQTLLFSSSSASPSAVATVPFRETEIAGGCVARRSISLFFFFQFDFRDEAFSPVATMATGQRLHQLNQ